MTAGRPPKPTADHLADGTFRGDRHQNRTDTKIATGSPVKPNGLGVHAAKLWDCMVGSLNPEILAEVDQAPLIRICHLWQTWMECAAIIDAGDYDDKALRRYIQVGDQFDKLTARFGMSPVDRCKLKLNAEHGGEEFVDPIVRLIHGRN